MTLSGLAWERMWAPYGEDDYRRALAALQPGDSVLDIGAGDLRLARRMAAKARRVYAVEINAEALRRGLERDGAPPANLTVICGDAYTVEIPEGVTVGVLLMRHCTRYGQIAAWLRKAGARRLITNARWGMDVEIVDLQAAATAYADAPVGWFACECGATGFKPGDIESWDGGERPLEVVACPACGVNPACTANP